MNFGRLTLSRVALIATTLGLPTQAQAVPFASANNLVALRVGDSAPLGFGSAASVHLDELNVGAAAASLVQSIDLPTAGAAAVTLPSDGGYHDGLLNRSVDGRYLVLAGYRANVGAGDPSLDAAADVPRLVVRVAGSGSVDSTTALTDSFEHTTVRAIATDDGSRFWVAGDNAGGDPDYAVSGGLRYVAALGASTSVNLSQTQFFGGPHTPDNIRSVGIFGGQLYDSSGSSSSIGKGVFQVGAGLPASGSQPLTSLLDFDPSVSTNAFVFVDLNPAVPGVDTLYTSTSAGGIGLHKYSLAGGAWTANGLATLPGISALAVTSSGSTATVYATDGLSIFRLTDAAGYNAPLGGSFASILDAGPNQSFRGLAFAPATPAALAGDYNGNQTVDAPDLALWKAQFAMQGSGLSADGNKDQVVDGADLLIWQRNVGTHAGAEPLASFSASAVPEPSSLLFSLPLFAATACVRRQRRVLTGRPPIFIHS